MRKVIKWLGVILGGLVGLLVLAFTIVYFASESKMNTTYHVQIEAMAMAEDTAAVERGQHLVETIGLCQDCHGDDLAGQTMDDDLLFGRLIAPNLTPGRGGLDPAFSYDDFVRVVRHGIDKDGHSVLVMPSNYYYHLSAVDLAAIFAYLQSLPPVDNDLGQVSVGPMGRLFLLLDPSLLPAQVIDHDAPYPAAPDPGITVEYGRYLAHNCTLCHGEDLAGVPGEGGGLNLTPGGDLGDWTQGDFIKVMRTGITPDNDNLDPELMPWQSLRKLTDDEIKAIWLYLQSLPPIENLETKAAREAR